MTLTHIMKTEEMVAKFNLVDESTHSFEAKLMRLIRKFEQAFVDEFYKRALIEKQAVEV